MNDDERNMEDFEAALREWSDRPTVRSAASAVQTALGEPARRTGAPAWWFPAAAAAAVLVVITGIWFISGRAPAPAPARLAAVASAPLDDDVVLWWIDPDTPVYFVLDTGDAGRGGQS